jgi:hypothetical protein
MGGWALLYTRRSEWTYGRLRILTVYGSSSAWLITEESHSKGLITSIPAKAKSLLFLVTTGSCIGQKFHRNESVESDSIGRNQSGAGHRARDWTSPGFPGWRIFVSKS